MAKRRLSDRTLKALKPEERRYELMDELVPGLGVRVTPQGKKTFILISRYPGSGNPVRRALGEYGVALTLEEARDKARQWLKLIKNGVDPREEGEAQRREQKRKRDATFESVAEAYFDHIAERRQAGDVTRCIRREFVTRWGSRPISDIGRDDVREVIAAIKKRGAAGAAHNAFAYLRAMFNWAIDAGGYDLDASPCDRIKSTKLIGSKQVRQRVLTDEELFAFWRNASRMRYPFGPLYCVLMLTGQRKSEVAEARWRELHPELVRLLRRRTGRIVWQTVDPAIKVWTVPPERFKSDASHVVPLSDAALGVFEDLPYGNAGDHVFSTTLGASPVNGFSKAKARLDARMLRTLRALARMRGDDPRLVTLPPFVVHDVRRTMRTHLSALKVPDTVAEIVIGHGRKGLQRVYDQHRYLDEMREALELWAARLRDITTPAPANVHRLQPQVPAC